MILVFLSVIPLSGTDCQGLDAWNRYFNDEYFDGRLPHNVEICSRNTDDNKLAVTTLEDHFIITFNTQYRIGGGLEHLILLHEDCHILTWAEKAEHGRDWKNCMKRLDKIGAFNRLLIESFQ